MSKEALEFLYKINPSFKNMDIDNTNTFSGEFLIYCVDKALKQWQLLPIDNVIVPKGTVCGLCKETRDKDYMCEYEDCEWYVGK